MPVSGIDDRINGMIDSRGNGNGTHSRPADLSWMKRRTAAQVIAENPNLRPYVISGILRLTETGNIIAPSKMRKSWLAMALGLCVVDGIPWLGQFQTQKGRVLLIDNELHLPTLAHRIPRVAAALGCSARATEDLDVISLRGTPMDVQGLDALFRTIKPRDYVLVIIDALYKLLPADTENDNSAMATIYSLLDKYGLMIEAAIVVVHHTSKGIQGGKSVTDVGAGAGAQSRAADTHIVLWEHEEKDCAVVGSAIRSSQPLPNFCIRWEPPIWRIDESIDATKIKRENKGGRPRKGEEKNAKQPDEPWTPERFVASFVGEIAQLKDVIVSRANRSKIPLRHITGLIAEAEAAGLIHRHRRDGSNALFYATKAQELFTKVPDRRQMSAGDRRKAVKMLCGLFAAQITQDQGNLIGDSIERLSFDAASDLIKSFAATQKQFELSGFLNAVEERLSRARAP